MKTFFKHNIKISICAIISVFIILAYFLSMDLTEWWKGAGRLFDLFYQLSIGYCLSFLFYILQVYIPETIKQKKAFEIIKEDISALSYALLDVVFVIEKCATISDDQIIFNKKIYYFKRVNSNQTERCGFANRIEISKASFTQIQKSLEKRIERITNNSMYAQNDITLIHTIAEYQSSHLFHAVIAACEANEQGINVNTQNVRVDFCKFKKIANRLWETTHNYHDTPYELNKNEIAFYHLRIAQTPKITGKVRVFIGEELST